MRPPKESFLERHIENFIGGKLKGISYDGEYLTNQISDGLIDFYIGFFQYYYVAVIIATLIYGITLMVKIHFVGKNKINIPAQVIRLFFTCILFFSFPFLFNFIIIICNLLADQVMSIEHTAKLYELMFGMDSYFNETLATEQTINAIEGQTEKQSTWAEIKEHSKILKEHYKENKTTIASFVTGIVGGVTLAVKSVLVSAVAIFAWISYTSLIIIRFMGLSLMFILAPIILPLTLFGVWGQQLLDKYFKTIINISFWVVLKAALDRIMLEFMTSSQESFTFIDDLSYMALALSYAAMIVTIPFISAFFIGGTNLSPTVAGAALLQSKIQDYGLGKAGISTKKS
jgi:hypothetical protein